MVCYSSATMMSDAYHHVCHQIKASPKFTMVMVDKDMVITVESQSIPTERKVGSRRREENGCNLRNGNSGEEIRIQMKEVDRNIERNVQALVSSAVNQDIGRTTAIHLIFIASFIKTLKIRKVDHRKIEQIPREKSRL
jgi:hypothetical protein